MHAPSSIDKRGHAFPALAGDKSGATAIVTALSFTALLGFLGLGSEVGVWYYTHRTMQAAADSSALSAAAALEVGNTAGYLSDATATAARYGFVNGANGTTVTVNKPPKSGNFTTSPTAVEVIIQQPQNELFSSQFLTGALTLATRAVAVQGVSGTGCVLALDRGASASTFSNGTTNVNLVACSLFVNSNSSSALTLVGSAEISAYSASIVGNFSDSGNAGITTTNGIQTGALPAYDPYGNIGLPPFNGCDHNSFSAPKNGPALSPGVYCNGFKVDGNATVQLNPGVYIIDKGAFDIAGGATLTGTDVTIVLTNSSGGSPATVGIHGGADITISAPSTGDTAGMAFIQDRNGVQGTGNDFSGGTTQNINGAIYFPKETVNFAGGTQTGHGCTQIVADEIDFKGNANLEINCSGKGTQAIGSGSSQLVE